MAWTTRRRRTPSLAAAARFAAERLEGRQLFAATAVAPVPDTIANPGTVQTIDLQPYFSDSKYSVVRLVMPQGAVDVKTLDEQVPANAANFLNYVTNGLYDGAIYHRSLPGFVLQGGSEYVDGSEVPPFAPVVDEESPLSNIRGTLSFARLPPFQDLNNNGVQDPGEQTIPGGGPNSATNGFFFNLVDNNDPTNPLNLDDQNGGFAVFGQVIGDGMTVVDAVTAAAAADPLSAPINAAFVIDDVTYTVASSDPAVVVPTIVDGDVVLTYGANEGTATITVTATDLDGATTVQSTFQATGDFSVPLGADSGSKSVTFTDADGTVATVTVKGGGSAQLSFDGTGLTETTVRNRTVITGTDVVLSNVNLAGSDAKTTLTISAKGGDRLVSLGDVVADGPVRAIVGKTSVLAGAISVAGAAGSIALAGANDTTITLGGLPTDRAGSIVIGDVIDTSIVSTAPIKSVKVNFVENRTGAEDTFTAPGIGSIATRGSFAWDVDVSTTGDGVIGKVSVGGDLVGNLTAGQIVSVGVKGGVSGSTISSVRVPAGDPNASREQGIRSIKVAGAITDSEIKSIGTIGGVAAGSIAGSTIIAGAPTLADLTPTPLPTTLTDFEFVASIRALKVKGTFANTNVIAQDLGKLSVGSLTTANGGTAFGFAGDTLASLTGTTSEGQRFVVRRAAAQADADAALANVTLGDARVVLL